MKFNTQVCTTREQSERLLALGLKKDTADMFYIYDYVVADFCGVGVIDPGFTPQDKDIPAWSLHRLIYMSNEDFEFDDFKDRAYEDVIKQIEADIKLGRFDEEYLEDRP